MKDKEKTGEIVSQLSNLANSYYSYCKHSVTTVKKHGRLKRLQSNRVRSNEGYTIILMKRKDYICGMNNNIVNDRFKFKLLTVDLTSLRERPLHRFLRKLKNEGFFYEDLYKNVYPTFSRPECMS